MQKNWGKTLFTFAGVLLGNIILAFAVAAFIVPTGIVMGGATGIALTITHYVPMSLSVVLLGVNVILFLSGAFILGKKFAVTTIVSTFLYPLCLSVVQKIPGITTLTDNQLLSAIYAGVLMGIGIGIIVRVGASTGGTDIIALILNKVAHIPLAPLMYVVDFIVLSSQILFSNSEQVMYGILNLVLTTVLLNKVMLLGTSQIQLFIISEKYEEIREDLLSKLDLGTTMIYIENGYRHEKQKGVMCIIPNRKLYSTKEMIHSIDPYAFITITQINEVRGQGFTFERIRYQELPEDRKSAGDRQS